MFRVTSGNPASALVRAMFSRRIRPPGHFPGSLCVVVTKSRPEVPWPLLCATRKARMSHEYANDSHG